ncbi:MAG TPA: SRPBCC family protein [Pyrinomonadaceae bacterium]|nr:SRPBCC family protein [Pyrinomonadaceae bacterium]
MSVDAKAEIFIERPRSEVADVMFDPKNDKLWITGLTNVFPHSPGQLETGSKVERVGTFLGRNYSTVYQVTRVDEGMFAEIAADEPFQMKIRYELGDIDGGTLAKVRIQSIGENEYQIPATALNRAVQDWIAGDLKRLKKRVEENAG